MQRRSWATRPLLIIAAAVVVIVAVAVVVIVRRSGPPNGVASDEHEKIPVGGGVSLAAEVFMPEGKGPFPLVVMPTAWSASESQYHIIAGQLAADGYAIVAYTQRGFNDSGGEVDLAGTPTRTDVSTVITWALSHAHADKNRIGLLGVSYGAGISLLAAGHDPRIKAVVALSSWADLAAAFDPNATTATAGLGLLMSAAKKTGRRDKQLDQITAELASDPAAAGKTIQTMSPSRSADDEISQLNKNHPAIFLANGFEDSLFGPQQLVDFYNKLTGPKRLQLAPGDHTGPEFTGILGQPNVVVDDARAWLAHYLTGEANRIDKQDPVKLEDVTTHEWQSYPRWPASTAVAQLGKPGTASNITTGGAQAWTAQIAAGTDTAAASGAPQYTTPQVYKVPTTTLTSVTSAHAFTWSGPALAGASQVAGTPKLQLTASASTGSATLFAYLYDVTGSTGALMSVTPYTIHGATAPTPVSINLEPISWTVAAGHHVALVIDTVDARWLSASQPGSTVSLSSSTTAPATLTLPIAG